MAETTLEKSDRMLAAPAGTWFRVTREVRCGLPGSIVLLPGDRLRFRGRAQDGSEVLICWTEEAEPVWITRAQCAALEFDAPQTEEG